MDLRVDIEQAGAAKGDLLLVIIVRTSPVVAPSGWAAVVVGVGADGVFLDAYAKTLGVDEGEGEAVFAGGNDELQGQLIVLRGGAPHSIIEHAAHVGFTSDATPDSPSVDVQQAINIVLGVWSVSGAAALTPPAGWTLIDAYTTDEVSERSILLAYRVANTTGTSIALPSLSGVSSHTGRSFALVLRDRPPHLPETLEDPVPGNIGLLAT